MSSLLKKSSLKSALGVLVFGLVFLSACSLKALDPNLLTAVAFNNRFVEVVNPLKASVGGLQQNYQTTIPRTLIVLRNKTIDVTQMQAAVDETKALILKAKDLNVLKSRNADQEKQILAEYKLYLENLDTYIKEYDAVVLFYKAGEYKVDEAEVKSLDGRLNDAYKVFAEEHNKFVTLLGMFKE